MVVLVRAFDGNHYQRSICEIVAGGDRCPVRLFVRPPLLSDRSFPFLTSYPLPEADPF